MNILVGVKKIEWQVRLEQILHIFDLILMA